jgi:hypothetical protein
MTSNNLLILTIKYRIVYLVLPDSENYDVVLQGSISIAMTNFQYHTNIDWIISNECQLNDNSLQLTSLICYTIKFLNYLNRSALLTSNRMDSFKHSSNMLIWASTECQYIWSLYMNESYDCIWPHIHIHCFVNTSNEKLCSSVA